ncbi:hypothetical protein [Endozoicomonas sp. Mp262]|uniref:hypothetical protein n=1 Tax=Endozoicomonas sp. Mp262 TaxID=2919499 RepID=UPI0021D82E77
MSVIQSVYADYNPDWHGKKMGIERLREGEPIPTHTTFCIYSFATNKFITAEKNTPDVWADSSSCLGNSFAQFYVQPSFSYKGATVYDPINNKGINDKNYIVITNNDYLYFEHYKERRVEATPRVVEAQKADASILKATPYQYAHSEMFHNFSKMSERGFYTKDTERGRIRTNGKGENVNDRAMVLKVY